MIYGVYTAKVGDKIEVHERGRVINMTVWMITPAGSAGRAVRHGPMVYAHISPDGYGISFDASSPADIRPAAA